MIKWKDERSYGKIRASATRIGRFKLSVHHYIHCGDTWFASAAYIFTQVQLESGELSDAKEEAEALLYQILNEAIKAFDE